MSQLFQSYYFATREKELISKGQVISDILADYMVGVKDEEATHDLLVLLDKFVDAQVTPLDRQSLVFYVLGGFDDLGIQMRRQEIEALLEGNIIVHRGEPHPLFKEQILTVAVPMFNEGEVIGGVFLSASMVALLNTIEQVQRLIFLAAIAAIILSTGVGFYLSKSISNPLQQMNKVAMEISQGRFHQQIEVTSNDEVGQLSKTFNYMTSTLEDTIEALYREKNKIESIMLSMPDGVIAIDLNGNLIMANPQARYFLGLREEKTESIPLKRSFDENDEKEILSFLLESVGRDVSPTKEFTLENDTILRVHVSPLKKNKQEPWGAVGVLQDVTKVLRLEQIRRDFVANVSHELRTPLTSIQGFTEAILDGLVEDAESQRHYLNIIRGETLRLSRLINDLLDLSRLDKGKLTLSMQPLALGKTIAKVVTKLTPQVKKNKLQLAVNLPQNLPLVLGDNDRIEQVLINLLNNAITFTPSGKKIYISGRQKNKAVSISIKDEGSGIPAREQPKIWERFSKANRPKGHPIGGTGLGLAIVKQIIDAHDGTITLYSKEGAGSTFVFTLPGIR